MNVINIVVLVFYVTQIQAGLFNGLTHKDTKIPIKQRISHLHKKGSKTTNLNTASSYNRLTKCPAPPVCAKCQSCDNNSEESCSPQKCSKCKCDNKDTDSECSCCCQCDNTEDHCPDTSKSNPAAIITVPPVPYWPPPPPLPPLPPLPPPPPPPPPPQRPIMYPVIIPQPFPIYISTNQKNNEPSDSIEEIITTRRPPSSKKPPKPIEPYPPNDNEGSTKPPVPVQVPQHPPININFPTIMAMPHPGMPHQPVLPTHMIPPPIRPFPNFPRGAAVLPNVMGGGNPPPLIIPRFPPLPFMQGQMSPNFNQRMKPSSPSSRQYNYQQYKNFDDMQMNGYNNNEWKNPYAYGNVMGENNMRHNTGWEPFGQKKNVGWNKKNNIQILNKDYSYPRYSNYPEDYGNLGSSLSAMYGMG